jgi:Undecaprenyl-phosphate glucose phosphotransferase
LGEELNFYWERAMANRGVMPDGADGKRVLTGVDPAAPFPHWPKPVSGPFSPDASKSTDDGRRHSERARNETPLHWERLISVAIRLFDAVTIIGTSVIAVTSYVHAINDVSYYYWVTALGAVLLSNCLTLLNTYQFRALMDVWGQIARILIAWSAWTATFFVCAFLAKSSSSVSHLWFLTWSVSAVSVLVLSRAVIARSLIYMWERGVFLRKIVVVGAGAQGRELARQLLSPEYGLDVRLLGVFDDRLSRTRAVVQSVPILGQIKDLVDYARRYRVDLIIIALPLSAEERIAEIIETLRVLPIEISLSPDLVILRRCSGAISKVGPLPLVEASSRPLGDWQLVAKAIEDKVLAAVFIPLLAPLMLLIAILVKVTSPGPVLFKQRRFGFNNRLITVFKFRTMYIDAADELANTLVTRNDPRVTPIGALLRKTSLDELPQLFNVLRGEMSIIGPRPHAINAKAANCPYEQAVRQYAFRHRVKPGMTGWAQVNGWRGETDTIEKIERRVACDLYYIENWTFWFDMKILLLTLKAILTRRAAH